ncbi:MAG: adenylate kinase [Patescibacteria group bacterium]
MLNLVIFGPPGAGKGTQAALIAKKYRLAHLSSGDLLRRELKNGALGRQIKKYQEAGALVPDRLIITMLEAAALKKIKGAGFIFDGYPRNLRQAKSLDKFFAVRKSAIDLVLNLKLSERAATDRILLRGKSSGRADDNRQTLKKRFQVYRRQTAPLLAYYRRQKKVINIDGRPAINEIFKEISKILNQHR